jgi:hypothetical protein
MNNILEKMIEVELPENDDFLKVRETLTRIGIASSKNKKLFQSCHILHKQGKYYIVHFKELFTLDGKPSNFSEEDKARRNTISKLLEDWELVKIINPDLVKTPIASLNQIKILSYKEKDELELIAKYNIGKRF